MKEQKEKMRKEKREKRKEKREKENKTRQDKTKQEKHQRLGLYTEFIKMADARKRSGVSYQQHGVEAF